MKIYPLKNTLHLITLHGGRGSQGSKQPETFSSFSRQITRLMKGI